ncbi:MAG TPA: putative porin, partial [Saprospiraceae bacterium]|nr:putative porin [Saprospiraceae bacterium]
MTTMMRYGCGMIFRYPIQLIIILAGLTWCSISSAQVRELPGTLGSTRTDSIPKGVMPLDTAVPVRYVLIDHEKKVYEENDSFGLKDLNHYPLDFTDAHLGNLGSAYRPLMAKLNAPIGFSTGWQQYDPYFVNESAFRYYDQSIPVTRIHYSQASQENTYLTLKFGRSFAKGLSLSMEYDRINQVGEFGYQRQKDTGLGIGVWHHSPSGRYDGFYCIISNTATTQENGGISQPELIGENLRPDADVPTFLTQGLTDHKHRDFVTRQVLHLTADTASIGMDIWLKARFQSGLYKYADKGASASPDYYGPTYLIDDRGVRQYTYVKENEESVGVTLPWHAAHSTIEGSLRYRGIDLQQEPIERKIHELYLDAAGRFQWVQPLVLHGELSLGLGQAQGTYSFRAFGELNTKLFGSLTGHWFIQSRNPYLMESRLYVNQELIYNRSFQNPFNTEVGVMWQHKKLDLEAGIKWMVMDQYIYFDSLAMPQQLSGSFSIKQIYVTKGFDFKWFGVRGKGVWQDVPRTELA